MGYAQNLAKLKKAQGLAMDVNRPASPWLLLLDEDVTERPSEFYLPAIKFKALPARNQPSCCSLNECLSVMMSCVPSA